MKDRYVFEIQEEGVLDITLSNTQISEGMNQLQYVDNDNGREFAVGKITMTGEGFMQPTSHWSPWKTNLYSVYEISGEDASLFKILQGVLYFQGSPDFETKTSYSITISATSANGQLVVKDFVIDVKINSKLIIREIN